MRRGDFAAFARDAVPPDLHGRVDRAWRQGRTRWPLDELPFADRLPETMSALAAPDAATALVAGFDRQFASAPREIPPPPRPWVCSVASTSSTRETSAKANVTTTCSW